MCKQSHKGRFFKTPDEADIAKVEEASERLSSIDSRYIPESKIPSGDETNRLHGSALKDGEVKVYKAVKKIMKEFGQRVGVDCIRVLGKS